MSSSHTAYLHQDLSILAIEGDDALTWLNGQVTNDIKKLDVGGTVYALALTTKGRVLADVLAMRTETGLFIAVPTSTAEALTVQFEKYIIMEDVTLRMTEMRLVSVLHAEAFTPEVVFVRSKRFGEASVEMLVASEALAEATAAFTMLDEAGWEALRIAHATPRFGADFGEKTYPQEAGLRDRAVSFQKGCYLGQEVVCMLENRGQVIRALVRLSSDAQLERGQSLLGDEGEVLGEITSVTSDGKTSKALGFLKRAAAQSQKTVHAGTHEVAVLGIV
jgi:folate-binding protein YgfZ